MPPCARIHCASSHHSHSAPEGHGNIWSVEHLRCHKAAEASITAARTALSGSSSMVRLIVITTPTKSHPIKSICLIIVIFYLRCYMYSQSLAHTNIVALLYSSVAVNSCFEVGESWKVLIIRSCEGRTFEVSSPYELFKLSCFWLFDRLVM